jgi:hypothetical protein
MIPSFRENHHPRLQAHFPMTVLFIFVGSFIYLFFDSCLSSIKCLGRKLSLCSKANYILTGSKIDWLMSLRGIKINLSPLGRNNPPAALENGMPRSNARPDRRLLLQKVSLFFVEEYTTCHSTYKIRRAFRQCKPSRYERYYLIFKCSYVRIYRIKCIYRE